MSKKILIITPRFPYPESGACEQDRAQGIRQLKRLGFDVEIISKIFSWQNETEIREQWKNDHIPLSFIPYGFEDQGSLAKTSKWQTLLLHPWCLDGAALEYYDPATVAGVTNALKRFKPDYVWFDYTYLWPLYSLAKKHGAKIIVRSINFEAFHFLDEDGHTPLNYLKFIPKFITEAWSLHNIDLLFSINPLESKLFRRYGAPRVVDLPLRSLASIRPTHVPRETERLNVFFLGSTYQVSHNRASLEFVLRELAPRAQARFGDKILFHIFGAKFPDDLKSHLNKTVQYRGYVDDLNVALAPMDIAVVPSLFGGGMQQKVFEPILRGFPTITHKHGLIGYNFISGAEICLAESPAEYIDWLERLQNLELRQHISDGAKNKSAALFAPAALDARIRDELGMCLVDPTA